MTLHLMTTSDEQQRCPACGIVHQRRERPWSKRHPHLATAIAYAVQAAIFITLLILIALMMPVIGGHL